jgi:Ser/Thr protein kinase RdoA (MazF antagonist)
VEGAAVVRVRSSIYVELPRAGAMARVEEADRTALAARQVAVAGVWAAQGAPVSVLILPQLQPFVFDDGAVTLWERLDGDANADSAEIGRTVRVLHDATRGIALASAPRIQPSADIEAWIDWPASWLADEDRAELVRRYRRLKCWWDAESGDDPSGVVLAHGDVHRSNTIVTEEHGVVFVDLEDAGVGPASWDLVPCAVDVRRYGGSPEEFRRFVAGYGVDPYRWSGFEHMCELYELSVTVWAIRCAHISTRIAEEAQLRVAGLLGRSRAAWQKV